MMSEDEAKIVKIVYARLIESEEVEEIDWSDIDDNLEMLGWLSDKEIISECKIRLKEHGKTGLRCSQDHDMAYCFAPYVLEAVESIVSLYDKTKTLHEKNKYIVVYYLAMSEMGLIYSV